MKCLKNPKVNLKAKYRKTLELALIVSLLIHLGLFHAFPAIDMTQRETKTETVAIEVEDIPVTEHVKLPPAPARPSVPIPTESEDVPEDITIETTELDLAKIPPPPPPKEEGIYERYVFIPYDEPPLPIGGYAAILANLKYPEIARKAGVEGRVVVGVLIDEKGNPIKTQVLKGAGVHLGLVEAAQAAVMSIRWKPALQRDQPVKVWVSIPICFRLKKAEQRIVT